MVRHICNHRKGNDFAMHSKAFRFESHEAEESAVEFSKSKAWAVPLLAVRGSIIESESGIELFAFMESVACARDAFALIEACFRMMVAVHNDDALHLDFHPKNIVLSETVKEGATTVQIQCKVYGVYCVDFETLWHPSCSDRGFDDVSHAWNDCRRGGMGRLLHSEYSVARCACYDVYTFSTYCIRFVKNPHFALAKEPLHNICNLDYDAPLPYVVADMNGKEQRYHTYLMGPDRTVKPASSAQELFSILFKVVDALAVGDENCEI